MAIESGSQILNYKGDAALGYGTAGTLATAAPIGVLDFGTPNQNGFDNVARLTQLKDKDAFDTKKKEADEMYRAARELDLDVAGLLDVDRQYIINNDIKKITQYLTAHPYALTPRTPDQIQENLEFKKLYGEFRNNKAKAQVRSVLVPAIDKHIAENTMDGEEEKAFYQPMRDKALEYITPYQKMYAIDWSKYARPSEKVKKEGYSGVIETTDTIDSNVNTVRNAILQDVSDVNNKQFAVALAKEYNSYQTVEKGIELQRQQLLSTAGKTEEQIKADAEKANNLKPYLFNEINSYNNYAADWNKVHDVKQQIPLVDLTKPLNKSDYAVINGTLKNVVQNQAEHTQKLSDIEKQRQLYQLAQSRINSKGKGSTSATTQDYLISGVAPFLPSQEELMYEAGINGNSGYTTYIQEKVGDPVKFGGKVYANQKVVKTPEGRIFTKVGNNVIEYTGKSSDSDEHWTMANVNIPIDDKIIQRLGGDITEVTKEGNKLKIIYKDKSGDPHTVYKSREAYLKDILEANQKGWTETRNDLEAFGIFNLDDDAQFAKAIELATTGTINGEVPKAAAPATQKKKLPGT